MTHGMPPVTCSVVCMDTTAQLETLPAPSMDSAIAVANAIAAHIADALQTAMRSAIREELAAHNVTGRPARELPEWMQAADVARELSCSPHRIYKLRCEGTIPDDSYRRDGRRVLIHRDWVINRMQGVTS